jgi:NAD(P)-dependent dehydrogenase (short-subunit alcohol dehydrogenase family)
VARVVISGSSRGLGIQLIKSHLKEGWRAIGAVRLRSPINHPNNRPLLPDITRDDTAIALWRLSHEFAGDSG